MASSRVTFVLSFWLSTWTFFIILMMNKSDGFKATEHAYLDHAICRFNPKFTRNCSCKLNFMTRLTKSISIKCFFTPTVEDAIGAIQLYYKYRNGYQLFLIDRQINFCDYFSKKTKSIILDMVWPHFQNYFQTDQNWTCPFYGRLEIDKMPLTPQIFNNMFVPTGNYMCNTSVFTAAMELIWNGKFYFNIPDGKTIEDDRMGR